METESKARGRPGPGRRPMLLICEDEEPLRELIRVSLGGDFDYVETADGRDVLELVAEHRPSAVVLDLMLPGTSGLEVLRELRADPVLAPTPVVAVSAWVHLEPEALGAGADRFVTKPFDPDGLHAIVAELVDGR